MRTTLAQALLMAALLTGATAAVSVAREPGAPASAGCHSPAPNQSGFGSRELSYRMCQEQRSASDDLSSDAAAANSTARDASSATTGANSSVAGTAKVATNNNK